MTSPQNCRQTLESFTITSDKEVLKYKASQLFYRSLSDEIDNLKASPEMVNPRSFRVIEIKLYHSMIWKKTPCIMSRRCAVHWVHQRDIMSTLEGLMWRRSWIKPLNLWGNGHHDHHDILHTHHVMLPVYSWYPSGFPNTLWCTHDIPQCT